MNGTAGVTCSFGNTGEGWEGRHHCLDCYLANRRACRGFARDVAAGTYDAEGFTPNERKAQGRRRHAQP